MKKFSIRHLLFFIVAALVIPACVIAIGFSFKTYVDGRDNFNLVTLQTAHALTQVVDRELGALQSVTLALAESPALKEGDLATFYQQAHAAVKHTSGFTFVLSDRSGQQLINTLKPFGSTLPRHGNPAITQQIYTSARPVISDLYTGSVTRQPVLSISAPVFNRKGEIIYELGVGIKPAQFLTILEGQHLPKHWIVAIVDRSGKIVARSKDAAQFIGQQVRPELWQTVLHTNDGITKATTLDGVPTYTMFNRSLSTGWTILVGVPVASVDAVLWHSLGFSVVTAIILLLIGFTAAALASRRITGALAALLPQAAALGQGQAPPKLDLALREAGEVATALHSAGQLLLRSEQERGRAEELLRANNCELERRVVERTTELRQSQRLLHSIIEHIPAMIFLKRADDLRFEMFNHAGELLLGYQRSIFLGKNDYDFFPKEQADAFTLADRLVLESDHVKEIPCEPITTANGEVRFLHTRKIALRDEDGQCSHLLGVSLDITSSRLAEEHLKVVATAFESQEAMMITDAHLNIVRINRAFSISSGYAFDELTGQTPNLLKSERHDEKFYDAMWQTIHDEGCWQGEVWNRRKNGEIYPSWSTITAIRNDDGVITNFVYTQTDITSRKRNEDEIRQLAFYDPLTSLPNRRLLMDRLKQALASSDRSGRKGALMFIDLDNFKTLNDSLGHDQGDSLLQQVAKRLPTCVRIGDTVARLGGDEFVVMLEELSENIEQAAIQAESVANKILEKLDQPYLLNGHEHSSTPSIGITLFSDRQLSVDELLKRADLAMYQAKAGGRNALRFFEQKMQAVVTAHAEMENEMHMAMQQQDFLLHYQAQVDQDGAITGAEVLLRWQHPQRGMISPVEFIPLAEDNGLIVPLGLWVLETACNQLAIWALQPKMAALSLAVNVSGKQFRRHDFVERTLAVVEKTGANPRRLKLELTESLLLDDIADIVAKMEALKLRGISFSLDDFGTGYSSLSYLKRLPLDQLKIDKSFVHDVLIDPNDAAIARTIVALGQTLGLAVIAEGVETIEQQRFLAAVNCFAYQGYLFSRPLPLVEFIALVARKSLANSQNPEAIIG